MPEKRRERSKVKDRKEKKNESEKFSLSFVFLEMVRGSALF